MGYRNIERTALAKAMRISHNKFYKIENDAGDKNLLDEDILDLLSRYLEVTPRWILNGWTVEILQFLDSSNTPIEQPELQSNKHGDYILCNVKYISMLIKIYVDGSKEDLLKLKIGTNVILDERSLRKELSHNGFSGDKIDDNLIEVETPRERLLRLNYENPYEYY